MKSILHDPTAELEPTQRPRLTPPSSLEGKQVALFDIGKPRSNEFLDAIDGELIARGIATACRCRVFLFPGSSPGSRTHARAARRCHFPGETR